MIKQVFRIDRKFWTSSQCDQVQTFFQYNQFFSKFYQHKDFDKITSMTYYTKVNKHNPIFLQNSKRPQAIVLLSGKIDISKKYIKQSNRKKQKKSNKLASTITNFSQKNIIFETISQLKHQNQTFIVQSQCKITSLDGQDSQILFVPSILYNQHIQHLQNQRIDILFKGLRSYFPEIQKKILLNLAKCGCYFKQFRMSEYIYRAGSFPEQVFLLFQGNVKLQKPGFSAKKMFQMAILNPKSMFGQKDINLSHRQKSAISCSAFARTLVIPKKPFMKFAKEFLPQIEYLNEQDTSFILPALKKNRNSQYNLQQSQNRRVKFKRFHSSLKLQTEKFIEAKLIKNCHILVNLSPKGSKTSRIQGNTELLKDYTKDQFKQKINLYNRIRPNRKKFNINNPIIQFTSKRSKSFKLQTQSALNILV